jgi:hypothetical protein
LALVAAAISSISTIGILGSKLAAVVLVLLLDKNGENVSQVINLGGLYCDLGHPKEAIGSLIRLGVKISPYGLMQEAIVRLRAAVELGDGELTERTARPDEEYCALTIWWKDRTGIASISSAFFRAPRFVKGRARNVIGCVGNANQA